MPGRSNNGSSGSRPHTRARGDVLRSSGDLALAVPAELIELVADRAAELVVELQAPAKPEPYMTVDQAALYLACKPKRVYDLCSQRRIPFRKDGSRTLLRRADLDAYLEVHGGR